MTGSHRDSSAPAQRATTEPGPSAPMTRRARSVCRLPSCPRVTTPATLPPSSIRSTHARAVAERSAGGDRRLGQRAVEQLASGAEGLVMAVHRRRRALKHGAVQVDPPAGEGVSSCCDLGQHAPGAEVGDAQRMDQVRRLPHLAGEAIAVEQQHAMALAGQKHGRGRARATGADDDRVVDCAPPQGVSRTRPG